MGLAEIMVDFCACQSLASLFTVGHWLCLPCSVRVMDCSSFSNSSVSVRGRCTVEAGRDIFNRNKEEFCSDLYVKQELKS